MNSSQAQDANRPPDREEGTSRRASPRPSLVGVHHVRLPVSDVLRSRDWYMDTLGFEPILDFEEAEMLVGVVLEHRCAITLGLHLEPERALALSGFSAVALCVGARDHLEDWCDYLDRLGVVFSSINETHAGSSVYLPDPDGILVQLHTSGHPTADEA